MEVLRKRITEAERFDGTSEEKEHQIKFKVNQELSSLMDRITKLEKQGKVLMIDPKKSLADFLHETLSTFERVDGNIESFDYCFTCMRNTYVRYKYRSLGHYDIEHAKNAHDCSADEIVSGDKAFRSLNAIPEFSGLKATVMRKNKEIEQGR